MILDFDVLKIGIRLFICRGLLVKRVFERSFILENALDLSEVVRLTALNRLIFVLFKQRLAWCAFVAPTFLLLVSVGIFEDLFLIANLLQAHASRCRSLYSLHSRVFHAFLAILVSFENKPTISLLRDALEQWLMVLFLALVCLREREHIEFLVQFYLFKRMNE